MSATDIQFENRSPMTAAEFSVFRQEHETECAELRNRIAGLRSRIALAEEEISRHEVEINGALLRTIRTEQAAQQAQAAVPQPHGERLNGKR